MFLTILKFELKYWLRQPSVYVYAAVFFLFSMLLMHGASGGWDGPPSGDSPVRLANSPLGIFVGIDYFTQLILFLLPAFFGITIYRDFRSRMHTVLYSYPLQKKDYLTAKFLSTFLVFCLIVSLIGLGVFVGLRLPGVPGVNIGPFRPAAFLQIYMIHVFPNVLLFGAIVFAAVAVSRNIYAGFITILLLYLCQVLMIELLAGVGDAFWAVIFDPFGKGAVRYLTRYWTLQQQNQQLLPVHGVVVYNRLLWMAIAAAIFAWVYRRFNLGEQQFVLWNGRGKAARMTKSNFHSITRIRLSKVRFDNSIQQHIRNTCRLSQFELRYILKSWLFRSILLAGVLAIFLQQAQLRPALGFEYRPMTWFMLTIPTFMFSGVINILTFLYAGILVHRERISDQQQLTDTTPIPNWVLLCSKTLALAKMQLLLLTLIMVTGIAVQIMQGHQPLEFGHYFFELYAMNFPGHLIWAFAAVFVQTLFVNPYLGFFLLLIGSLGLAGLPELGLQHYVFRFNLSPELQYSDISGYERYLTPFFLYKAYWMLSAVLLLLAAILLWVRGLPDSFRQRLSIARSRFQGNLAFAIYLLLIGFVASGWGIYYEDVFVRDAISATKKRLIRANSLTVTEPYKDLPQPRILAVRLDVDIFPKERGFRARGEYLLVNKSSVAVDTLLLNCHLQSNAQYQFERDVIAVSKDTISIKNDEWEIISEFEVVALQNALAPGDSTTLKFTLNNDPTGLSQTKSMIRTNGTFIKDSFFPALGYRSNESLSPAQDSSALRNPIGSVDADWIDFETIVSTSIDQMAVAPGSLVTEWVDGQRRYFHYRIDGKMPNGYAIHSGLYRVEGSRWNGVDLKIYHHPTHQYNLDHFMQGIKATLAYCSENFGPYPYRELRWVEFPRSEGRYANAYPMMISCSEDAGFNAAVKKGGAHGSSVPVSMAAHEIAHQWWGYQVLPANVLGSEMILESLPEYINFMVMKHVGSKEDFKATLQQARKFYFRARAHDKAGESPLMYNSGQPYLRYQKGALVFYALSEYIGEKNLNLALKSYFEKVRYQSAPYTSAAEIVAFIRQATPDSLQYLITDLFETITLYDNRLEKAKVQPLEDGRYQVDIRLLTRKFRSDGHGKRIYSDSDGESLVHRHQASAEPMRSLPLQDYIDIAIFGQAERTGLRANLLRQRKFRITSISQQLSLIVDERPSKVVIDPDLLLIDVDNTDNSIGL